MGHEDESNVLHVCVSVGFEDDVVTLILAIGRCRALRQLSLGRNFVLKSRLGSLIFVLLFILLVRVLFYFESLVFSSYGVSSMFCGAES